MCQQWRDLLFLHWEYSVAAIQAKLPEGLFVDTFAVRAYLGIVPFFMRDSRPRFLPAVPGVWFYSLDANQRLALAIARRFFHLPYEHAKMESSRNSAGVIRYESVRTGDKSNGVSVSLTTPPGAELPPPAPGSLEFFLVERYRLYSSASDGLRRGAVFHPPYPLRCAEVTTWDEHLLALDGFAPSQGICWRDGS